jgi:hypothetical protein
VQGEVHDVDPKALERIAVVPFLPSSDFRGSNESGAASTGGEAADAAAVVSRIASEAFAAAGFEVIPASDLASAFEARGAPVPHGDPLAFAQTAAREFGATSILVGTVYRYRERRGGQLGATRPASVGIQLELYEAPTGAMLWIGRFDHIQQALSENVLVARRYPGRGSRWLSAAELARWGLDEAARKLAELR